jgi:hypothetical protein
LTESNTLTPFLSKSVEISTVHNAIPTQLEKTDYNKNEQVVIPSSSTEIPTDRSENFTDNSPNCEQSNDTSHLAGKRIADSQLEKAGLFTFIIKKQRLGKIEEENFSQEKLISEPDKISREMEYTRSISMENQPNAPFNQPTFPGMDFTPTADTPGWARVFMQRFEKQDQVNKEVMESISGITTIIAELNKTKAELNETKHQLEIVIAERDALKRKYMGSSASIHAGNTGNAGKLDKMDQDQHDPTKASPIQVSEKDKDMEYPVVNGTQLTMAQKVAAMADKPVQQRRKRVSQGQRKAAARVFMEPSDESGFTSVYLPCRRRMPISELRGNLRKLKIANHRVLDVSYPAQKVVALLVHQEYAKELLERFEAAGVKPIENFDALDAKVITDPKWADKSENERADRAHEIHRVRCLVALDHIRIPVKYAVARHFVRLGWIESEILQVMQNGEKLAPPREQSDAEMQDGDAANAFRDESESLASATTTNATPATPTDGNSGRTDE